MADVTVTAADVRPLNGAVVRRFDAGGTLAIGNAVYIAGDGDVEAADGSAVGTVWAIGIVVATPDGGTAVSAGERADVVVSGPVAGFSSLTPGALGYVSDTAGAIADAAGTKDTIMGFNETAAVFHVRVQLIDLSTNL